MPKNDLDKDVCDSRRLIDRVNKQQQIFKNRISKAQKTMIFENNSRKITIPSLIPNFLSYLTTENVAIIRDIKILETDLSETINTSYKTSQKKAFYLQKSSHSKLFCGQPDID